MKSYLFPLTALLIACSTPEKEQSEELAKPIQITMETTKGTIVLELSNKTPQHRDNFVSLVEEGAFDSLLFHRVINEFVIQAGDPDSKYASDTSRLGEGDRDYKVPAEFDTSLFHKRGALGAARDGNPERASSAMQFYIVQRGPRPDSLIDVDENRINGWIAQHYLFQDSTYHPLRDSLNSSGDRETYRFWYDSIQKITAEMDLERYTIPESQREVYRTLGGTPHLDQNYTVFGEVIEGMAVVDSIASVQTNEQDRPVEEVRILSARMKEN